MYFMACIILDLLSAKIALFPHRNSCMFFLSNVLSWSNCFNKFLISIARAEDLSERVCSSIVRFECLISSVLSSSSTSVIIFCCSSSCFFQYSDSFSYLISLLYGLNMSSIVFDNRWAVLERQICFYLFFLLMIILINDKDSVI